MRNKKRIKPFIEEVGKTWEEEFPDWRFGQLMINFLNFVAMKTHTDGFYYEDDKMLELFREFTGGTGETKLAEK